jgi:predicted ATPase
VSSRVLEKFAVVRYNRATAAAQWCGSAVHRHDVVMDGGHEAAIRTPDQRLRIFVSSTLRELETERRAARAAIERLRLAPVMFELGARPHPPRALYRSYLEQSDVFVGIYAQSYGWVAPGEEISGLEDEYVLAPKRMPKLIYVKRIEGPREERLDDLIDRIRSDDTASYKAYETPEELAELIEADLATLLAERFDASRAPAAAAAAPVAAQVPPAYTRLIGREREVAAVAALMTEEATRLVTLLGPGGVGKSRLAIEIASATTEAFPDGAAFIMLENVTEPALLVPSIAYGLGIRDTGEQSLEERLSVALSGRRMLIVLDNFEQLVDAAPTLVSLYSIAPSVTFLVTSRTILRIRGERVHEVPPLLTSDPTAPDSVSRAGDSPAVRLFVERARAVRPDFELTEANLPAVVGICRELEGLPLAIELAAACIRVLTPAGILERLGGSLMSLLEASRDLPARQRTLRSTIEWSTELLDAPVRDLLFDLAVFSAGFTLEAVEAVGRGRSWDGFAIERLGELIDSSLVRQEDADGRPVFSLLATVREYGLEQLAARGRLDEVRDAHAGFYADLIRRMSPELTGPGQREATRRLTLERANLRAAMRHLVAERDAETATALAFPMYLYWWLRGYFAELSLWMTELLERAPDASPHAVAIARFYIAWAEMWNTAGSNPVARFESVAELFAQTGDQLGVAISQAATGLLRAARPGADVTPAVEELTLAVAAFRAGGHRWGEALSLVALGRLSLAMGRIEEATAHFRDSLSAATAGGDSLTESIAMHHIGRMQLFAGDEDAAATTFIASLALSLGLDHDEGVAYAIEGLSAIAALAGDLDRAGVLAGAAETIRQRVTMFDLPAFVYHTGYLERAAPDEQARRRLAAAHQRGREYSTHEVAEYTLEGARPGAVAPTVA